MIQRQLVSTNKNMKPNWILVQFQSLSMYTGSENVHMHMNSLFFKKGSRYVAQSASPAGDPGTSDYVWTTMLCLALMHSNYSSETAF